MAIVYERSGGFAGFKDSIRLEGDGLELSRRNAQVSKRTLSADESRRLEGLVTATKGAPAPAAPAAPGRPIPDAFTYRLTVDGDQKLSLVQPHAPGPGEGPWAALTAYLDGLLNAEIQRAG